MGTSQKESPTQVVLHRRSLSWKPVVRLNLTQLMCTMLKHTEQALRLEILRNVGHLMKQFVLENLNLVKMAAISFSSAL